jgi:hypothetical protein
MDISPKKSINGLTSHPFAESFSVCAEMLLPDPTSAKRNSMPGKGSEYFRGDMGEAGIHYAFQDRDF